MTVLDFERLSQDTSFNTSTTPPSHFPKRRWFEQWRRPKVDVPLIEINEDGDYREALERAYKQYPDKPYKIQHFPGEIVIVPPHMIDEIKNAPESKLSFQQASYDIFVGQHTGVTNHERAVANILRVGVLRLIDAVYPAIQDEALRAILSELGNDKEWKSVLLFPKSVNFIMAISRLVFVGEPLCRNPEWLKSIVAVTQHAFGSVPDLWQTHDITRPLAAWQLPSLQSVRAHRENAKKLLTPILQKRLEQLEDPNFKPPVDLMQVVIDNGKKNGEGRDVDYQLNAIIGTGRAALFTASMTTFQTLYDLASRPEYIEPLRQEAAELGDAPLNRSNVGKLTKLDSFLRESQRWNMFMLVSVIRKAMKSFSLSDGTFIPEGAILGFDIRNAVRNKSTLENPNEFDGFRFERLRAENGKEQMFQSVQTANDHLVYGHGTQACPGRFFAAHEVKVLVARILLHYDIKLKDPRPGRVAITDQVNGIMVQVDPTQEFLIRRRSETA
ncbi:hypothetical protein GJ744_011303 [Endocarpon pusillum]|uniref:Cytochrome P450 n=1 Tax=Endocarpon pusillum TaxID=364733 RepID=A0A8H7AU77_9EURO|nr:hypothetical protein GJ744_011303 [Endocarpon pusillum]